MGFSTNQKEAIKAFRKRFGTNKDETCIPETSKEGKQLTPEQVASLNKKGAVMEHVLNK